MSLDPKSPKSQDMFPVHFARSRYFRIGIPKGNINENVQSNFKAVKLLAKTSIGGKGFGWLTSNVKITI